MENDDKPGRDNRNANKSFIAVPKNKLQSPFVPRSFLFMKKHVEIRKEREETKFYEKEFARFTQQKESICIPATALVFESLAKL